MAKKKEEKIVTDMLLEAGFEPYLKGFKFWVSSILIMAKDSTKTMEEVYDEVADKFKDNNSRVERAMRNVREHSNYKASTNKKVASMMVIEYSFKNDK